MLILSKGLNKEVYMNQQPTDTAIIDCIRPYQLVPKMINLCHHYRARSAYTSVQSNQALYCWMTNLSSHLDIPKMKMDSANNGRWINPFMKWVNVLVHYKWNNFMSYLMFVGYSSGVVRQMVLYPVVIPILPIKVKAVAVASILEFPSTITT